jgi:hypothetical protein
MVSLNAGDVVKFVYIGSTSFSFTFFSTTIVKLN